MSTPTESTREASKLVLWALRESRERNEGRIDYVFALGLLAGEVMIQKEKLQELEAAVERYGSEDEG